MIFTNEIWSFNDFKKDTKDLFADVNTKPGFEEAVDKMQSFTDFVPIRYYMLQGGTVSGVTSKSLVSYLDEFGYVYLERGEAKQWWNSSHKTPYFEDDVERINWSRKLQLDLDFKLAAVLDEMIKTRNPGIDDDLTDILRI